MSTGNACQPTAFGAPAVREWGRSVTTEPGPLATGHRLLGSSPPVRTTERRPLPVADILTPQDELSEVPRRRRRPPIVKDGITPLSSLPQDMQERIADAVSLDEKPEKWLYFGGSRPLAAIVSRAWCEWHWQRGIDPDRPQRRKLSADLRADIILRDGLVCGLCGNPVALAEVHIDHVLPVAHGGSDDPHNLQVAHALCNIRKGARV